uniref:Uncharacterized protein n=1 Tax=Macrostomum lignano TaxID=282301 RepID=A0A1I8FPT0_9PLAT
MRGSSGGGGARGTTNHKSAGDDRDDQNNHLQRLQRKTSNSDAELHVHVVSHQSASIRRQRPQLPRPICVLKLDKFSCCWGISAHRSIVESDSGDLCGFWQFQLHEWQLSESCAFSCSSRRCTALDCRVSWCSISFIKHPTAPMTSQTAAATSAGQRIAASADSP